MKILITGAAGQVGRCLQDVLFNTDHQVTAFTSADLDITDASQVSARVGNLRPDVIINAAAYTAVDKAESEKVRAFQVNAEGPANLAQAASDQDIPLLHLSTDYVFDGRKDSAYQPDDTTGPQSAYGESKLLGEQAVAHHCEKYLIIRTSWVVSEYGNNFLKSMLRLGNERDQLSIVNDQRGCPTYAGDIAQSIVGVLSNLDTAQDDLWGIYHYAGSQPCTWYEFALEIFSQAFEMGLILKVPVLKAITTSDYPTPAVRPMNSVLDSSLYTQRFSVRASDWKVGVSRALKMLEME